MQGVKLSVNLWHRLRDGPMQTVLALWVKYSMRPDFTLSGMCKSNWM